MPTVAGYARLSIAKDTSVSIAAQHQMLQRWAEVHDRPITLYTDDGYSGSKAIERPAFERMQALRVQVDALVVPTVETMRATGEVLGDLWARDRRLVIEQAIERVHVLPATTKRSPVGERVVVEWKG